MKFRTELIVLFFVLMFFWTPVFLYYGVCAGLGHGYDPNVLYSQYAFSFLGIVVLPMGLTILFRMWKLGDAAKRKKTIKTTVLFLLLLAALGFIFLNIMRWKLY